MISYNKCIKCGVPRHGIYGDTTCIDKKDPCKTKDISTDKKKKLIRQRILHLRQ